MTILRSLTSFPIRTVTAIALEDINNSNVLKSYSLNVTHFDSNCEAKDGLIAMVRELDRAKT